jgi:hypothetical protein
MKYVITKTAKKQKENEKENEGISCRQENFSWKKITS